LPEELRSTGLVGGELPVRKEVADDRRLKPASPAPRALGGDATVNGPLSPRRNVSHGWRLLSSSAETYLLSGLAARGHADRRSVIDGGALLEEHGLFNWTAPPLKMSKAHFIDAYHRTLRTRVGTSPLDLQLHGVRLPQEAAQLS
jgi:hypothetical protein